MSRRLRAPSRWAPETAMLVRLGLGRDAAAVRTGVRLLDVVER